MASCSGRGGTRSASEADSIYTWENIRQLIMEEPEQALEMIDVAETRGLADVNYANWMRAQVYYGSPKIENLDKARDLCLKILDNKNLETESLGKQRTLSLLVNILASVPDTYQDAVRYAIQGAELAHHAGDILQEASFYFEAGKVMERLQQGSGIDYMNRSLDIYRKAAVESIQPLPILSSNLGNMARILSQQEKYDEAIPLLQERLQAVSRIEKEYTTAPAGWADQQRAYTYTVLAYCQHMEGEKEAAHLTAEAFERTKAAQQPGNQMDIMNYYALAGNAVRIQQIYDRLEPYYREKEDTISQSYASLLYVYAMGLDKIGRGHEAYQASYRYKVINDSLVQRERQAETLKFAQQMKTQEKELQLKDEEAKTSVYRIVLVATFLVCLLLAYVFWRTALYNRKLFEKNRRLLDQIEQREREQLQAVEQLEATPEADLTSEQQLYRRLCQLMDDPEQIFTNADLDRSRLAQLVGTNEHYVSDAISACTDGKSTTDFINSYRLRYAAQLLANTKDSVALIAELCGLSRRTFYRLFNEAYSMSPSDYRQVVRKKE